MNRVNTFFASFLSFLPFCVEAFAILLLNRVGVRFEVFPGHVRLIQDEKKKKRKKKEYCKNKKSLPILTILIDLSTERDSTIKKKKKKKNPDHDCMQKILSNNFVQKPERR